LAVDLDGDGSLDVLSSSAGLDEVSWWAGDGAGGFGSRQSIGSVTTAWGLAAGDMDGDGDLDVVAGTPSRDDIVIFYNEGSSWTRSVIDDHREALDLSIVDLDADGDLDILAGGESVLWLENDGSWTRHDINSFTAMSVSTVDFDSDGDLDVLAGGGDGVFWFENDGSYWNSGIVDDAVTRDVISVNLNAETNLFAATSNGVKRLFIQGDREYDPCVCNNEWVYETTYGAGLHEDEWACCSNLDPQFTSNFIARDIEVLDFGFTTIVQRGDRDKICHNGELSYCNNDNHAKQVIEYYPVGEDDRHGDYYCVKRDASFRFSTDPNADVRDVHLMNGYFSDKYCYSGFSDEFRLESSFNNVHAVSAADLNGDGFNDILAGAGDSGKISWWLGYDDGGFGEEQLLGYLSGGVNSVVAVDLDADGDLDVLAGGEGVAWFENDGSWTKHLVDGSFTSARRVLAVDLDGDGSLDVLSSSAGLDEVSWWAGDGAGGFGSRQNINTLDYVYGLAAGDMDADGDLDVVAGQRSLNAETYVYYNNGDASSWSAVLVDDVRVSSELETVDLDGDGDLDILNAGNSFDWFENDGSWTRHEILRSDVSVMSVVDFDSDGDFDIWADGRLYDNSLGDGSFWIKNDIALRYYSSVSAADVNDDGSVDLLGGGNNIFYWLSPTDDFNLIYDNDLDCCSQAGYLYSRFNGCCNDASDEWLRSGDSGYGDAVADFIGEYSNKAYYKVGFYCNQGIAEAADETQRSCESLGGEWVTSDNLALDNPSFISTSLHDVFVGQFNLLSTNIRTDSDWHFRDLRSPACYSDKGVFQGLNCVDYPDNVEIGSGSWIDWRLDKMPFCCLPGDYYWTIKAYTTPVISDPVHNFTGFCIDGDFKNVCESDDDCPQPRFYSLTYTDDDGDEHICDKDLEQPYDYVCDQGNCVKEYLPQVFNECGLGECATDDDCAYRIGMETEPEEFFHDIKQFSMSSISDIEIADLNGDGLNDIAAFRGCCSLVVFYNEGGDTFNARRNGYCTGSPPSCNNWDDCQAYCESHGCSWSSDGGGGDGGGDDDYVVISCPFVYSWNGTEWVQEHEAFPFSISPALESTSYDSLPSLKCVNGEARVRVSEELLEVTNLKGFDMFKVKGVDGFVKPDINGRVRVINDLISPSNCSVSTNINCLDLISDIDNKFVEPSFNETRIDDWVIVKFNDVNYSDVKLYFIAKNQQVMTNYGDYLFSIFGGDSVSLFYDLMTNPITKSVLLNTRENFKMQVELWDGEKWVKQGALSAGHHMPGGGADDFLVSINKPDELTDLIIRFRFMTGMFSIDYVALDDSPDPDLTIEKATPLSIKFNGVEVDNFTKSMMTGDNFTSIYPCTTDESFFFNISGYYEANSWIEGLQKDLISASYEYLSLIFLGKPYAVRDIFRKGLYKDSFTQEELIAQRRPVGLTLLVINIILMTALAGLLTYFLRLKGCKRKKVQINKRIARLLIFLIISILIFFNMISIVFAVPLCAPGDCHGTADSCSTRNTEYACENHNCLWRWSGYGHNYNFQYSGSGSSMTFGRFDRDGGIDLVIGGRYRTQVFLNSGVGDEISYCCAYYSYGLLENIKMADMDKDYKCYSIPFLGYEHCFFDKDLIGFQGKSVGVVFNDPKCGPTGFGCAGYMTRQSCMRSSNLCAWRFLFGRRKFTTLDSRIIDITVDDFDGDKYKDVAAVLETNELQILLNDGGSGVLVKSDKYTVGQSPSSVVSGDFDSDGDKDLAVANSMDDSVSILLNDGGASFVEGAVLSTGIRPFKIELADFNNDDKLDLIVGERDRGGYVRIFLQNKTSDNLFSLYDVYYNGQGIRDIATGDLNSDGYSDFVISDSSGLKLYHREPLEHIYDSYCDTELETEKCIDVLEEPMTFVVMNLY
ncbi:hypothetical protein GF352_04415, partial [archaeon]|nr:hypothetical protein [archaeon]